MEGKSEEKLIASKRQPKISSDSFSLFLFSCMHISLLFCIREERERDGSCDGSDAEDSTEAHGNSSLCASQPYASPLFRSPLSSRSAPSGLSLSLSTFFAFPFSTLQLHCFWIVVPFLPAQNTIRGKKNKIVKPIFFPSEYN